MKRKMALLEQAHGLLCNAISDSTSAEDGETWLRLRAEWIARWEHVIRDQQSKEHNARVAVGNEAIGNYEAGGRAPITGPAVRRANELHADMEAVLGLTEQVMGRLGGPLPWAGADPDDPTTAELLGDARRLIRKASSEFASIAEAVTRRQLTEQEGGPPNDRYEPACGRGICALGEGHEGRCRT